MKHNLIISSVSKHIQLTEEEVEYFTSLLKSKVFSKKQFVLHSGEVCGWSIFVTKGCLRGYSIDKNGIDHVLSFAPEGWWIADLFSLLSKQPALLNIEALEDTEVLLLYKKDQELLYEKIPKFERFFRIIIENALVAHQQRIMDSLSITAEEKYLKFCKTYPTLINSLPQKQIAAYIGVTPEFFSRMRSRLLRK